jgi:phage head maturation protease
MNTPRTMDLDLDLEVREEPQDGYLATLYGRAVPYDTPTRIGGLTESFDRESFTPSDVIGKPLAWRHGDPIGVITAAHNREDGLYITASIVDTQTGRDANALLRAGAVRGLSVGFLPSASKWLDKARTRIAHTAARAIEVSLTHQPAYATAGVSEIREDTTVDESTPVAEATVITEDVQAREAIADVRATLDTLRASIEVAPDRHPLAEFRDGADYLKAVYQGEQRATDVSILSEQTGLIPPTWLSDIKGVMDRGRPCISAIGGPMGAGDAGMTISWPTFGGDLSAIVATQTENTEPNSVEIKFVSATATLATYAAYNGLTWQVIDRTSPSYVQAHMRVLMGAYGTETDYAFQNSLWANDTVTTGVDYAIGSDTTGSAFVDAVWKAATEVEFATGQPADVVYVSTAVWAKLASWSYFQSQNYPVQNTRGVIDGANLRANVLGLPIVLAREFATDGSEEAIVTNRLATGWAEVSPRFVSTEVPSAGGKQVAIYGYGVATPFIPTGIRSIYNTP